MKTIDFLPAKYRQQQSDTRRRLWRLTTVVLFGAVIAGAATWQFMFRRSALDELTQVEARHAEAVKTSQRLTELTAKLTQLGHQAQLFTYLKHPWPRTQILSAITGQTGDSMQLTEISLHHSAETQSGVRGRSAEQETPVQGTAARQDLATLRKERDPARQIVTVVGVTQEPSSVNTFVAMMSVSPLFIKAELVSLESLESDQQGGSQFVVRLEVRPGYGQPGGPTEAPEVAEMQTTWRIRP